MFGGLRTNQGIGLTRIRVDAICDHCPQPRRESGQQDRAEEKQKNLQAMATGPERDVRERLRHRDHGHHHLAILTWVRHIGKVARSELCP
jgi:hypothetical protein